MPFATPLTTPELLTVAMDVTLLLQVPPVTLAESVILADVHTDDTPEIVPELGNGLMVIVWMALLVPQVFVKE